MMCEFPRDKLKHCACNTHAHLVCLHIFCCVTHRMCKSMGMSRHRCLMRPTRSGIVMAETRCQLTLCLVLATLCV